MEETAMSRKTGYLCLKIGLIGLLVAVGVGVASAADYPGKPLRLIAPNEPGGPSDIIARTLAQKLSVSLGQSVIVENRAGAGGNIGTEVAANARPDGYTLVTGNNATFGANITLYKNLPFDPVKSFSPVVLIGFQPNILCVHPSLPVTSVKQFIAHAKAHPGALNYGASGQGQAAHLAAELFKEMTGTNMVYVGYKSAAPALIDLISGQIQVMFATALSVQQHIQSGKVRPLAVTTAKRSPAFPDLPTIAEAGVQGFEATTWHGIFVPAGTPAAIVSRLNAEINSALQLPDVRNLLGTMGADISGGTPQELADHVQREIAKWAKVINNAGIKLN
jgi:tripartite-type tricarboxylate transporter receptor subunit TctC